MEPRKYQAIPLMILLKYLVFPISWTDMLKKMNWIVIKYTHSESSKLNYNFLGILCLRTMRKSQLNIFRKKIQSWCCETWCLLIFLLKIKFENGRVAFISWRIKTESMICHVFLYQLILIVNKNWIFCRKLWNYEEDEYWTIEHV